MMATKKTTKPSAAKTTKKPAAAPAPKKRIAKKASPAAAHPSGIDYVHGVHGNRGTTWPAAWKALAEAYGGNARLVEEIGVTYNTVYVWAVKGGTVPAGFVKLIGFLSAAKGLPNPAAVPN